MAGVSILCRSTWKSGSFGLGLAVGDATIERGSLISQEMMGSWNGRGKVAALNHQRRERHDYHKANQGQRGNQDVWSKGIIVGGKLVMGPENNIEEQFNKVLLDLYNQRNSRSGKYTLNLNHYSRESRPGTIQSPRALWMKEKLKP